MSDNNNDKSIEKSRSRVTTYKNKLRNSYLPPLKNKLVLSTEPDKIKEILFTEIPDANKNSVITYRLNDEIKEERIDFFRPKKIDDLNPEKQNAFNSAIMQNKYWGQQVTMGFRSNIAPRKIYKDVPKVKRINKIS